MIGLKQHKLLCSTVTWKEYIWFFKLSLCRNKSFVRCMLAVCIFAKTTERKISIFVRRYNQRLHYQTKTEDNFLLQNSLFDSKREISSVTLAYLLSFLIKIVMEIQFLQVLWGNQWSICTPETLPGHSSATWHKRTEHLPNSLVRSVRMEVRNLILPQFRLCHITASKSQSDRIGCNFRFCKWDGVSYHFVIWT